MRSSSQALGVVVVIIGGIALVASIGHDTGLADSLRWLWPLAIVGAGLWLLLAATGSGRRGAPGWNDPRPGGPMPGAPPPGTTAAVPASSPPVVPDPAPAAAQATQAHARDPFPPAGPAFAARTGAGRAQAGPWSRHERFFGEIELAGPFTLAPATYETVFGEIRLDLSAATLPEGETYLRVGTVFGEVRVLLSADAAATVRGSSLLGEIEVLGMTGGSVMGETVATTDNWPSATRRLRIDARTMLGGVAVRRARPAAWPTTPGPYGVPGT